MSYDVLLNDDVVDMLQSLPGKSKSIVKKNLKKLEHPYPGRGSEDKEKLVVAGQTVYRLHSGRTYTAFYIIDEKNYVVRVLELLSIEAAHKKYGF